MPEDPAEEYIETDGSPGEGGASPYGVSPYAATPMHGAVSPYADSGGNFSPDASNSMGSCPRHANARTHTHRMGGRARAGAPRCFGRLKNTILK